MGIFQSQPPPPEDDASGVGWDDSGMAPEVEDVILAEEYEDLNVHPVTMDRTSDSPQPSSPRQAAALDEAILVTIGNDGPDVDSVGLEMEFLSTQPPTFAQETRAPELTPDPGKDTRKVESRPKGDRTVKVTGSVPFVTHVEATAMPPPASHDARSHRPHGRGFLRLKAPLMVTTELAPERRPRSSDELPPP